MRFDARSLWQGISRYHGIVARAKRKHRNGAGSPARLRKDGRYEARATLNTTTGRRRVSFYGATAKEAKDERLQALADEAKGIIFSDPGRLTVGDYLDAWLHDTVRYQVRESTFNRYEQIVRNHLRPFFDRLRLRDLTPASIRTRSAGWAQPTRDLATLCGLSTSYGRGCGPRSHRYSPERVVMSRHYSASWI